MTTNSTDTTYRDDHVCVPDDVEVWLDQIYKQRQTYHLLLLSLQSMKTNPNQTPREALLCGINQILD